MIFLFVDCFLTFEKRTEDFFKYEEKTAHLVDDWFSSFLNTINLYHIVGFFYCVEIGLPFFCSTFKLYDGPCVLAFLSLRVINIAREREQEASDKEMRNKL